ncbi:MAG: class I SAM-dependent methyltransferase [Hyphomicrobiales bacterium]|nr:class I SAM-dependent methyltransferase [Hyphomicrobiales bacterium]
MLLLGNLLGTFVQKDRLRIIDAGGRTHEFGQGEDGATVTARLHQRTLERKLFFNPELYAAEAYMDGTLTFEGGSTIYDFLFLFSINRASLGSHPVQGLLRRSWKAMRRRQQSNTVAGAKAHVEHHYDLSIDLYRLFLDKGLNYSCGYFRTPDDSLEEAQEAKLVHILSKLRLEPGMSVLEIGGGWGSLAILLAQAGANVVSLSLSSAQIDVARQRVEAAGVANRVEFRHKDYREVEGKFDRVVSVAMMEQVGIGHFDEYFSSIRDLIKPGGYAFIHCIGRMTMPGTTGPFIRRYIFPGGYVPALSEVFAATERMGLWVADMEVLRLHYYYTIRHWRERFEARRDEALALYDERFCRMWEFYLAAVELGFLHGSNMVFHILLSNERDAVPIVRDFMLDDERRLLLEAS